MEEKKEKFIFCTRFEFAAFVWYVLVTPELYDVISDSSTEDRLLEFGDEDWTGYTLAEIRNIMFYDIGISDPIKFFMTEAFTQIEKEFKQYIYSRDNSMKAETARSVAKAFRLRQPPIIESHKDTKSINDGGDRISYGEGKAIREPSTGKGRFDLITPFGLERLARWYELGAAKYSDRNWEKGGIPFSRYLESALRHLNKFMMGMDDEDHLAAASWNILCIMHHQALGEWELDDMPDYLGNKYRGENEGEC